jgi:hypothetical protein
MNRRGSPRRGPGVHLGLNDVTAPPKARTRVGAGSSPATREAAETWTGAGVRAGGLGVHPHIK